MSEESNSLLTRSFRETLREQLADPEFRIEFVRECIRNLDSGDHQTVKAMRLGLTQEEFASRYRIPIGTLRDWEQARKFPDAPARAYLLVIDKDPGAVARLLGESAA